MSDHTNSLSEAPTTAPVCRIYDDTELLILQAAANLLHDSTHRIIDLIYDKDMSRSDAMLWSRFNGFAIAAGDAAHGIVTRHTIMTGVDTPAASDLIPPALVAHVTAPDYTPAA